MKKIVIEELSIEELLSLLQSAWEMGSAVGDTDCLNEAKEVQIRWFQELGLIK